MAANGYSFAGKKSYVQVNATDLHMPTIGEIDIAREAFETHEPRDLFYRAATELVELAMQGRVSLSLAEAVAVLLQTWNKAYYRFNPFDEQHFLEIENLLKCHREALLGIKPRSIRSISTADEATVKGVFQDFEQVLGPVGAAKCLHLLAPYFFPLWDRAIAKAYGFPLGPKGKNADRYYQFLQITRQQCEKLGGKRTITRNPLKAIDEYNYCKFTTHWI